MTYILQQILNIRNNAVYWAKHARCMTVFLPAENS